MRPCQRTLRWVRRRGRALRWPSSRHSERFASLGQDDVDGRVVRYRRTGRRGLGDDLSLWNVLGVGVCDRAKSKTCVGECLLRIILGLAAHVGYGFHVDTLGHVELHVGSLMDRGSTRRVGASDGTGRDVIRKLLLDREGQPHRAQIGLNVCEGAPIGGGHRQVGAGAVFGPPPGASNSRHREEEDDQAHPQGCTLVCCRRARLLGRWDRRGSVDRCHGRRRRKRPRELCGHHLRVQRCGFRGAAAIGGGDFCAPTRQLGRDGSGRARYQVDCFGSIGGTRGGVAGRQRRDEIVDFAGDPGLGSRRLGDVVGDVMGGDLQR